jgi:replicative DNA helicase
MKPDQIPPNEPESEVAVLSCMLRDPAAISNVLAYGCTEDWFYDLRNKVLFQAARDLFQAGVPVDIITLSSNLDDTVLLSIGGIIRLNEIADAAPSAANLTYWLDILRESEALRKIAATCSAAISEIHEHISTDPADALVDKIERTIQACRSAAPAAIPTSSKAVEVLLQNLEERYDGRLKGVSTGLRAIDSHLRLKGMAPGELVVVAARPSGGKTALVCNIMAAICKNLIDQHEIANGKDAQYGGSVVLMNSLEMSRILIYERLVALSSGVNTSNLQGFSEVDFIKMSNSAAAVARFPLLVDEESPTLPDMIARAKRQHAATGLAAWFVDYLELIPRPRESMKMSKVDYIGDCTRSLKRASKDLNIPVVVVAQLNREAEKGDRRPRLSDLRSSGDIEQDADVVIFIHRDDEEPPSQYGSKVELITAKQRNGPTGSGVAIFNKSCGSMADPSLSQQPQEQKW